MSVSGFQGVQAIQVIITVNVERAQARRIRHGLCLKVDCARSMVIVYNQ